jgi:hypothetical protein
MKKKKKNIEMSNFYHNIMHAIYLAFLIDGKLIKENYERNRNTKTIA